MLCKGTNYYVQVYYYSDKTLTIPHVMLRQTSCWTIVVRAGSDSVVVNTLACLARETLFNSQLRRERLSRKILFGVTLVS